MRLPPPPSRPSPSRRLVLWTLALALVLAPVLVGMHRMLHLPTAVSTAAPQVVAKGLSALFLGHDAAECQLLDQLIHGGAPATAWIPPLTHAVPACPSEPAAQTPRAHAALPFLARAPPQA